MFATAEHQLIYRVANAGIREYPFPHLYVEDVFPKDFYTQIRQHLLPREALISLKSLGRVSSNYPDTRVVMPLAEDHVGKLEAPYRLFWEETAKWLLGGRFANLAMLKFGAYIEQRFPDCRTREFHADALLVQDETNYLLSPHTDAPHKVLSFLFYLPPDESMSHLGTSIYLPRDPQFTCPGGRYWPSEQFERIATMPYVPNTLFAFLKTTQSFHGVERVNEPNVRRDLLLLDIQTPL